MGVPPHERPAFHQPLSPSLHSERGLVRLVNAWNWKDFIIIYEEDDAIIRLKDFMKEEKSRNGKCKYINFKTTATGICFGKLNSIKKYLITSLDLHTIDMEDFQYGKTNITGLRLVQEQNLEFKDVLKEINARLEQRKKDPITTLKTESTLIYDGVKLFASSLEQMDLAKNVSVLPPISCTLMNKGIDGTTLFNFMKNAALPSPGLSGMIEFDAEGFRSRISLDVIYLTASGLTKIGTIVPSKKGEWSINIVPPEYPSDFQFVELENSNFRVTTKLTDPYVMYRESAKKMFGNERFEGYAVDLLNALAEYLHFTFEINPVKDGKHGSFNTTTKLWNGMIGEIFRDVSMLF
ncbi:glutamate receptor ionotropic, kainate 2 [Caerostris extrusa]|uniref:Glutamate receptor ionotropic, kainate 2 n=1 Tax=Caerostris extrusa TaxID=172846 RepID=A0AAV4NI40_CAEEX|nr:glutamate receptor ionotropic, kainate 2 [Caerostris extrusa]